MKKILSFALSLSFLAQSALALDYFDPQNGHLCWVYQQKEYKIDDPEGDALLAFSLSQIPKFVESSLKKKKATLDSYRLQRVAELLTANPEFYVSPDDQENIVVTDYVTERLTDTPVRLEGHKAPFTSKTLATMMAQVMTEEFRASGVVPSEGRIHRWSQDERLQRRLDKANKFGLSKVLVALSRGVTSRHMVTGTEEKLKAHILSRPDNSITLEEMFRSSYRINKGDVYLTLLTIENVLSRNWTHPQRNRLKVTTKLKDITNYNYATDKFGSWYHLFGIMLYGYTAGGLKASIVGNVESLGSSILSKFEDEKQEDFINSRGGRVGAKVRDFVKKEKFHTFELNAHYLEESYYLDLSEDFTARLEKLSK